MSRIFLRFENRSFHEKKLILYTLLLYKGISSKYIMNQEINNLIENSEMNIDFLETEIITLPQLIELINKYTDKYRGYKNGSIGPSTELLKIYGNNKLILKPKSDSEYNFIEKDRPNPILWKFHKTLFYKNFDKAVSRRKQLQIEKRKADIQAYQKQYKKQKIICDICQGKYLISNKAKHFKTQKHIKCEDLKKN